MLRLIRTADAAALGAERTGLHRWSIGRRGTGLILPDGRRLIQPLLGSLGHELAEFGLDRPIKHGSTSQAVAERSPAIVLGSERRGGG